ncbi:NmrA family transcriptional regulator [Reticulibacter mediterranei]|uniref:NmrA family transcriptional regulator n=1 Tax=Reticulibacter mediterranei TaxID=2778369 RepID=A0A8J3ITV8_9CHLR|nr:NmrA/HSCARG family protein [Reticulibacter mediterranei]GHO97774.1 NmrA family transcriptional regulator [Reticulibacter mediterranei]
MDKIILVTGATGQQGGATARQLLEQGWQVRAFVRNPDADAAQALRQIGAELVQGDQDDPASLEAAMQGVYGVFSVQAHTSYETRHGKNVADAVKRAGVPHLVYSSVGGAPELFKRNVNVPKWQIEQYIRQLDLPATILRPVGFMDSLASPLYGVAGDTLAIPFKPDTTYPLIAVSDIGTFAVLAFTNPATYLGQTIELAGDAPTPPQIADAISRVTGRVITYVEISLDTVRQQIQGFAHDPAFMEELARASEYINERKFTIDFATLRKLHPDLMDFETWLIREGKAKFSALTTQG